jgi:hypothetical protein
MGPKSATSGSIERVYEPAAKADVHCFSIDGWQRGSARLTRNGETPSFAMSCLAYCDDTMTHSVVDDD